MKADLLVTGRIATLAGEREFGWVEAIAVAAGRVIAAGRRDDVQRAVTRARRRLDLPTGRAALPGLTDAHIHLVDHALSVDGIDLSDSPTLGDGLARIAAAHAATSDPAAWLGGHGWDPGRWGGWPAAADLERAAPGRRVALWSHDHHTVWASDAALRSAGIDAGTADPPGGAIRRLPDGRPAGCLHELAAGLVMRHVPRPTRERMDTALLHAARALVALGVTAIHDPGEISSDVDLSGGFAAYARLGGADRLPLRVHASVRPESLQLAIERGLRSGDRLGGEGSRARVGWVKMFADGTLGARTAWMLAPYEADQQRGDPPGGPLGLRQTPPEEIARIAARAAGAGIATQVHAIGDRAVRESLDALRVTAGRAPLMPRIEHAQLVDPVDAPRFAPAGIAACVQPRDIRADAGNAWRFWGAGRVERGAYRYGSLVRSGAVVAFGTDAPVESPDPWPAISTAVTRRSPDWPPGEAFIPSEALTLERAVRAACLDGAIVAGEPDRGRLVPGSGADIVVLDGAALEEPVEPGGPLEHVRPDLVLVDGEVVFEA